MNKFTKLLQEMNEEELLTIKNNLETGLCQDLVIQALSKKQAESGSKICPVCHAHVEEGSHTLVFGPDGFRKRASFCALDCLEYFIGILKEQGISLKKAEVKL